VVEYLYKDESKILNKSEDTEFISNILVVADQFLIGKYYLTNQILLYRDCLKGVFSKGQSFNSHPNSGVSVRSSVGGIF